MKSSAVIGDRSLYSTPLDLSCAYCYEHDWIMLRALTIDTPYGITFSEDQTPGKVGASDRDEKDTRAGKPSRVSFLIGQE